MKIEKVWDQYQHYTRDVTTHARQLGFGAGAICWIFKEGDFSFPGLILGAFLLLFCYFVTDLLQSYLGALSVKTFAEAEEAKAWEKSGTVAGITVEKPRKVDRPAQICFKMKIILLITSYGFIASEVLRRILV